MDGWMEKRWFFFHSLHRYFYGYGLFDHRNIKASCARISNLKFFDRWMHRLIHASIELSLGLGQKSCQNQPDSRAQSILTLFTPARPVNPSRNLTRIFREGLTCARRKLPFINPWPGSGRKAVQLCAHLWHYFSLSLAELAIAKWMVYNQFRTWIWNQFESLTFVEREVFSRVKPFCSLFAPFFSAKECLAQDFWHLVKNERISSISFLANSGASYLVQN